MDDKWRLVMVTSKYGASYPDDFDRNREYEFKRVDGEPKRFKMADQSPYFNVEGMLYRECRQAPVA